MLQCHINSSEVVMHIFHISLQWIITSRLFVTTLCFQIYNVYEEPSNISLLMKWCVQLRDHIQLQDS